MLATDGSPVSISVNGHEIQSCGAGAPTTSATESETVCAVLLALMTDVSDLARRLSSRNGHPLAGSARDDRRPWPCPRPQNMAICSAFHGQTAARFAYENSQGRMALEIHENWDKLAELVLKEEGVAV